MVRNFHSAFRICVDHFFPFCHGTTASSPYSTSQLLRNSCSDCFANSFPVPARGVSRVHWLVHFHCNFWPERVTFSGQRTSPSFACQRHGIVSFKRNVLPHMLPFGLRIGFKFHMCIMCVWVFIGFCWYSSGSRAIRDSRPCGRQTREPWRNSLTKALPPWSSTSGRLRRLAFLISHQCYQCKLRKQFQLNLVSTGFGEVCKQTRSRQQGSLLNMPCQQNWYLDTVSHGLLLAALLCDFAWFHGPCLDTALIRWA